MVTGLARGRRKVVALALVCSGLTLLPSVAHAQDQEARLRKIESEVRALQRTVFPGPDGKFFTPEVAAPGQGGADAGGSAPATSAVTDILGRLDSMETQLQRLTAQTEENTNAIAQLAARLDAIEAAAAAAKTSPPPVETPAIAAAPVIAAPASAPAPAPTSAQATIPPATRTPAPAPAPTPAPAPAPTSAPPSAARVAAVKAIVKPATADAGDDEYTYGFRLWEAKFYPEAQQQLQIYIQKYPRHAKISYGRNLLGRAYLDDRKPDEAATWFFENYKADKAGERAPDSLLFLAEAMIMKGDTAKACIALAELGEVYPAIASGRLQAQYKADSAKVRCQ